MSAAAQSVVESTNKERPIRVGLVSLGCAKNLVDAEIMLGTLAAQGMEITSQAEVADAVIINTCSFIDAAQEESVDSILESAQFREAEKLDQAIIVSGCLSQRYRDELPKLFPEVDAFMGIDQVARAGELVREALARRRTRMAQPDRRPGVRPFISPRANAPEEGLSRKSAGSTGSRGQTTGRLAKPSSASPLGPAPVEVDLRPKYIHDYETPRFRLTPPHFAYVKIAEGCNHPCSFCIIPRMRGRHRSRPQADVVREARQAIEEGVRELNLISQDSTYYGLDLRSNPGRAISSPERFRSVVAGMSADATTLCTLLRELDAIPGDFWVRLLYTHPAHWTDELIETIASCRKVVRYVDMPLQHIHDVMLERMRRETSREHIEQLIRRLREGIPGIALRTTFIVGFPGETEAYFDSLLAFIRETRFERLGVFSYSREDRTVAGRMAGHVPDEEKERRRDLAMAAQQEVAREISSARVGQSLRVLVEREATVEDLDAAGVSSAEFGSVRRVDDHPILPKDQYKVARGEADAPDIDGRVYVRGELPLGEFAQVKVVGHTDYDLIAESAGAGV